MDLAVADLWRYPVKSLQGERLEAAEITTEGIVGDRAYGIVDDGTQLVLTARRGTAAAPRGCVVPARRIGDDHAARRIGRARRHRLVDVARILRAPPGGAPDVAGRYEIALDFEHEDSSEWFQWDGPAGPFHDSTRTRVSLVSEATIRHWDARRFRTNVLLSGAGEEALVGSTVRVGAAELDVGKEIDRCVIVTRPQPGGIGRDLDVLRTINRERGGNLGVGALVRTPGRVAVGVTLQ